jgi:hypothetical protein
MRRLDCIISDSYKAAKIAVPRAKNHFRVAVLAVIAANRFSKLPKSTLKGSISFGGVYLRLLATPIKNLKLPLFTNDFEVLHSLIYSVEDNTCLANAGGLSLVLRPKVSAMQTPTLASYYSRLSSEIYQ